MKKILANLSVRQKITIALVSLLITAGIYSLVHWQKEAGFKPLFTGLAPEDASGIVQKLKEGGVEYRLPESGGAVLVPASRLADLRLTMAAAGLPKSGRIGFELFDKTNLGATEFTEHVNYRRALEGELERSVICLAEVEQARVHLTFPKDSVFLDAQQPAKASVLVKIRPGMRLAPQNVQAINHLVASAVEGLSPDAVSVLDMNGNLLGRPRPTAGIDAGEPSEAVLDYRRKVETDLLAKVNSTLEALLGPEKFRAGISVDCDFSGAEESAEVFDPARSVMLSSQRTEDTSGPGSFSGVPGTASTLPRPASRPGSNSSRVSRVTENITYQSSRTVRKTRLPAGSVRKMSLAVLVDQELTWQRDKNGFQRILQPPSPEKLKIIRDLVAGVTGFSAERGDQLVIETLPFETTLMIEPPPVPGAPVAGAPPAPQVLGFSFTWNRQTLYVVGGTTAGVILISLIGGMFLRLRRKGRGSASVQTGLPQGEGSGIAGAVEGPGMESELEAKLAERDAMQKRAEAQVLTSLKLAPVITKTAEVLAKHLREKIAKEPEVSAQVLRTWIREEEEMR
jgi:flagellar M-ring protein FliF